MHKPLLALLLVALTNAAAAGFGTAQGPSSKSQQVGKASQGTKSPGTQTGASAATIDQSSPKPQTSLRAKSVKNSVETGATSRLKFGQRVQNGNVRDSKRSGVADNIKSTGLNSSAGAPSGAKTAANGEVVVGFASGAPHKPLIAKNSAKSKVLPPPSPTPTSGSREKQPPKR